MSEIPFPINADETLARAEARFPAVVLALRHWETLRAGRPMPERDEIDPRALGGALEFLFVAESVAPGVARLRLAGQHLAQLIGMEPRGMPLCALFTGQARAELAEAVAQVAGSGLRVLMPIRAEPGPGRPALDGLLALMPLAAGSAGRGPRILGALQTRGPIGRVPRRLTLAGPAERLALSGPVAAQPRTRLRVIPGGRA